MFTLKIPALYLFLVLYSQEMYSDKSEFYRPAMDSDADFGGDQSGDEKPEKASSTNKAHKYIYIPLGSYYGYRR